MSLIPNFNDLAYRTPYILAFFNDRKFTQVQAKQATQEQRQQAEQPDNPAGFYWHAYALGRYARGIQNRFMRQMEGVEKQLPAYPVQNALTTPIRAAAGLGFGYASESVGKKLARPA